MTTKNELFWTLGLEVAQSSEQTDLMEAEHPQDKPLDLQMESMCPDLHSLNRKCTSDQLRVPERASVDEIKIY